MYYEDVFRELNSNDVRYLVVGGTAIVLHGIVRLTADLDIMVDMSKENIMRLVSSMENLGYKPRVPVDARELADAQKRKSWVEEKNMKVFSFLDSKNQLHIVDVLVKEPIGFEEAYDRKIIVEAAGIPIPVVSLEDLIRLKEIPKREKDLDDLKSLKKLRDEIGDGN